MKQFFSIWIHLGAALAIAGVVVAGPVVGTPGAAAGAQKFRIGGQPVVAQADGTLVCEAEEFRVVKPGWEAKDWGANYYAATFANTFLSRKAFLGAPQTCEETVAQIDVQVPAAGRYLVLVRYEAAYRFETQFHVRVEQGGQVVLDRLYGARDNVKIWAFRQKLKKEVAWGWGAVENVVWEGHDVGVQLEAGKARLSLIAGRQKTPAAKRNVDLVMLTTAEAEVLDRIEKENYLPLDGMLTQSGDVHMRLRNQSDGSPMTLTAGPCTQHSPYWVHMRNWKAVSISADPGGATEWVEVGGLLDTLNDGQWALKAKPYTKESPLHYKVEIGVRSADGAIETISEFESRSDALPLAYHADTRYSRLLRSQGEVLYDLVDFLQGCPVRGVVPRQTPVFGYTFDAQPDDPKYSKAVRAFSDMFGLADSGARSVSTPGRGYVDVRGVATDKLADYCAGLGANAKNVVCVSLGDEIGLPAPPAGAASGFHDYLKSRGLAPAHVNAVAKDWGGIVYSPGAAARDATPGLYYWSRRYLYYYGIQQIKARTDLLRAGLPNAEIGANFSPHHGGSTHSYLGEVFKWVTCFREDGMTMPWSEDYIWQLPVGSPQMNFINLDLSRAGLKGKPERRIHYYVMPHWPGNTPAMWRRQFYGDVMHGMKIVNLFEFRPVQAAYTENHVNLPEMFLQVRTSLREMGLFEDIMQRSVVRPGLAGLWFSETADIWGDNEGSMAAGKRSLYIAIRHSQIPLDCVVEDDALDGTLGTYRVLYLTDRHVSRAASRAIADWVRQGGTLFATAGAGMLDELNEPNAAMRELLGLDESALGVPEEKQVGYIKQDLPFREPIDTIVLETEGVGMVIPAIGVQSRISAKKEETVAAFKDGSPAIVRGARGKGRVVYCAFLPGLSYFKPAIPHRPVDRGSSDDAMAHFIPTEFNRAAGALIGSAADGLPLPVVCSSMLVESGVLESPVGLVIPLVNWGAGPVKGLAVTVAFDLAGKQAELAGGGAVVVSEENGKTVFRLDLDVADALILR